MQAKGVKIREAKSKLLPKLPDDKWDFGHRRESEVTDICKVGMENSLQCRSIALSGSTLHVFYHQIAIRILHQFMGFRSEHPTNTSGVQTYVENSIVTFARIDAFIAMTVVCLRKDGMDTVGGHRQKLYHEAFKPFVAKTCSQIIGKVLRFIQDWVPHDLKASTVIVHAGLSSSSVVYSWEATVEIFVPSSKRQSIAVSWDWFVSTSRLRSSQFRTATLRSTTVLSMT